MDDNCKTPLIRAAIKIAATRFSLPARSLSHSDRGSNYTSDDFAGTLAELDILSLSGEPELLRQFPVGILRAVLCKARDHVDAARARGESALNPTTLATLRERHD